MEKLKGNVVLQVDASELPTNSDDLSKVKIQTICCSNLPISTVSNFCTDTVDCFILIWRVFFITTNSVCLLPFSEVRKTSRQKDLQRIGMLSLLVPRYIV